MAAAARLDEDLSRLVSETTKFQMDLKEAQQMLKLMDALDDNEDTKNVFSNADISDKDIEASLA